jgi:hypothetical protein
LTAFLPPLSLYRDHREIRASREKQETRDTPDFRGKMDSQEKLALPDPRVHQERPEMMELL